MPPTIARYCTLKGDSLSACICHIEFTQTTDCWKAIAPDDEEQDWIDRTTRRLSGWPQRWLIVFRNFSSVAAWDSTAILKTPTPLRAISPGLRASYAASVRRYSENYRVSRPDFLCPTSGSCRP
jgi:hypothetical protein